MKACTNLVKSENIPTLKKHESLYKLSIIQKHTNLKISENILTWKKKTQKPNILILNNPKTDIHEKKNWKHTTWKKIRKQKKLKKLWTDITWKKSESTLF